MADLDNILSGRGEAMPSPEPAIEPTSPEPQATETLTEPDDGKTASGEQKTVPHEALHAEKLKVKRYTEEVADFRKQLQESNAAWERRMAELVSAVRPKQEPQAPPDFFENPGAATMHAVAPQFEAIQTALMANAKLIAGTKYGDDEVERAEKAFLEAYQNQQLEPADYAKVVQNPNRYAAAVQWHKRQQALAEIGDDPAAYKERLKAELLAELQTPQTAAASSAPVMPSNLAGARNVGVRSGPAWEGPKALGDIFKR